MSEARDPLVIAENRRQMERLSRLGWYHSIELPDGGLIEGHQTIAQLRRRLDQFHIPADLTGKRVLDIGAWDGWFSFEMERRGARRCWRSIPRRIPGFWKLNACWDRALITILRTSAASPTEMWECSILCCFWACCTT